MGGTLGTGQTFTDKLGGDFPAENIHVRRYCPVHHSLRQAGHRIEQYLFTAATGGHGITAVCHPARCSGDHCQNPHAHGRGIIGNAMMVAVAHGSDRILAGNDLFPYFAGFFRRHVEFRPVLARKGNTKRVFAHRAAAQGQLETGTSLGTHDSHSFSNGIFKFGGQRRREYGLLQGGSQTEDLIKALHVCGLNKPVQLTLQAVIFHKTIVGADCHGKAVRHGKAGIGGHFAQICHFAPHKSEVTQAYLVKMQDKGAVLMWRFFQQSFHLAADTAERLKQPGIGVAGKSVQFAHHLKNSGNGPSADGMHIIHAERFCAVQAVFHLAHGFKGALVGRKQTAEARATLTQARLQLFLPGQFLRIWLPGLVPPYPVPQIFEERHLTQRSEPLPPS